MTASIADVSTRPSRIDDRPAAPPEPRAHLTDPKTRAALVLQNAVISAARDYLRADGFVEMLPPLIGPVTDPGARGAKQVDVDYYGHRYKLMTSAILYKQASLLAFDKVFFIAPNVRLEPLETGDTGRHLAEFHQIDVEVANASRDQIMQVAEGLVRHTVRQVLDTQREVLDVLGRDPEALARAIRASFDRTSHADAVEELQQRGHAQSPDAEMDWAGEVVLTRNREQPVFVVDYPKGSRGFYDRERADAPGVLENFDLLLPEGYGEVASGSVRENKYRTVLPRMRETGENPAKYAWYLDLLRAGIPPSAGFGIGVERLNRFVGGLDAAWQSSAFPKVPGVVAP